MTNAVEPAVVLERLTKWYAVPVREVGLKAVLTSLIKRRTRTVEAVKGVSFTIAAGEVVGFRCTRRGASRSAST